MRIAVINEVSASPKNGAIVHALQETGHEVLNLGMTDPGQQPQLTYLHTGLMAALVLNLDIAQYVVGGCGTGQGFLISAMQYPGVFCGLLTEPLDAWLFSRINKGNCISLPLNKGYGWASEQNLKMLFAELFKEERAGGYPAERAESQRESRQRLREISCAVHRKLEDMLPSLEPWLTEPVFSSQVFRQSLDYGKEGALLACCRSLAGL